MPSVAGRVPAFGVCALRACVACCGWVHGVVWRCAVLVWLLTFSPLCFLQMRHVAAYLLLVLGGNAAPTADDVKGVLAAADIEADQAQLDRLLASLEGKSVDEIIEAGKAKLAKMTVAAGPAAGAGGAAAAGDAPAAAEPSSSSSAGGAAADLFGGSDSDSDSSS